MASKTAACSGYHTSHKCCLGARCAAFPLVLLLTFITPQLIVDTMHKMVQEWSVLDTTEELEAEAERKHEVVTFNFYNLTNALALQTQWPPPKPTFEMVPVRFNYTYERLNSTGLEHGMGYKYVAWSYYDVHDVADADLEIVQVNPVYVGAMQQFGAPSESAMFAGLSTRVLGMISHDLFSVVDQLFAPLVATAAGAASHSTDDLRTAMGGLASLFGHGELGISNDLFAITDFRYLQFGAGLLSQAALMNPAATSLADHELFRDQGVCTPVELYAYLNHANGPLAAGGDLHAVAVGLAAYAGLPSDDTVSLSFSMSIKQAKAFLDTMTVSADMITLAGAFGHAFASDPVCASVECATARSALTMSGPLTETYGKLQMKAASGATIMLCDSLTQTGLAADASPLTSGQCALLALAYTDYLVNHIGPRFVMGCQLVGGPKAADPLVSGGFTLRADGTGAANSGLFTRHTVRELWFGWDDPLMALAGGGTFGGLAGIDIPEPADLLAKFAAGTEALPDWSYSYTSGKGLLADRGKVLRHPDGRTMGSPGHPGYRLSDGKLRAGDFDPEGLHKVEEQPMLETWPSAFAALQAGLMTSPVEAIDWGPIATGAPIDLYFTDIRRDLELRCQDGCPWDKVKGKVYAKAYTVHKEEQQYNLHEGGVASSGCGGTVSQQHYDASVAFGMPPAGNPSTCDYGMRYPWVFDLSQALNAPAACTLAYCGNCDASVRDTISILNSTTGEEVRYDADAHGAGLWYEPLTGWLVKGEQHGRFGASSALACIAPPALLALDCVRPVVGNERMQTNWMVERSTLDSPLYANIFGGAGGDNDVFVWPYMWVNREQGLTAAQADEFSTALYGGYLAAKLILLLGLIMTGLLAVMLLFDLRAFCACKPAKTEPM